MYQGVCAMSWSPDRPLPGHFASARRFVCRLFGGGYGVQSKEEEEGEKKNKSSVHMTWQRDGTADARARHGKCVYVIASYC